MASIDYQQAREEIVRIFHESAGEDRKIIFWYDAPGNFREDILADSFDGFRLLVCDRNEFAVKKTIEHDDPFSSFLVYIPSEKPLNQDNWLLDILMYSSEYFADTVALTMRRLNLSNSDLRRVIERHIKFFDSETRVKKLSTFIAISDNMSEGAFTIAMMTVLTKAAKPALDSILTELVFDLPGGSKYAELRKYGFEEYLWDAIARVYNYGGEQRIELLTRKFLFTALLEQGASFEDLPSFYQQYTITDAGKLDARFFVDQIKKDKRYKKLQELVADDLKMEGLLITRDMESVVNADVFECIDKHIIRIIASGLKNGSLDYDAFENIISIRRDSMWYEAHNAEYSLLSSAIAFFKGKDKPIPKSLRAEEYIRNYKDSWYLIDTYYRHFNASFRKIENPIEEFEWLSDRVELSYQYYLDELGKEYSDALAKKSTWEFAGIEMTDNLYQAVQRNNFKKLFVIISDGLRYEIGQEIYEQLQVDPILKGSAEISCAVSPLPSETRFGMAALLPHRKTEYSNKAVSLDGMPTNLIEARNAILQARNKAFAAITYEKINSFSRADLRTYMADKSIVYIYHNVVDNAGEHNESKVFDMVPTAVDEILGLVRKLFSSLQISNFFITADHGFLYRRNKVEESMKYSNIVSLHPTEASKRYIITDDDSLQVPYTNEFRLTNISNGQYRVITPYAYDLFKTQGTGLQYIHGGASLQETIVPVIRLGEMRSSRNKDAGSPVTVQLKSITRKITNRTFTLEFQQCEKVEGRKTAASCETYLEDENREKVSGEYKFTAASESDDPETRVIKVRFVLKNIEFDRNKRYFLVLRDSTKNGNEYIDRQQFMIDILNFKMF